MIEKRITESLLEAGALTLTPGDRTELELPEHSTTIDVELEGETFGAQWSGRSRQLSGDILAERLQDYGQVGGLLRLRSAGQSYRLQLLPPGSQMQVPHTVAPRFPASKPAAGTKAARRRATVDRQLHSYSEYDWGPGNGQTVGFLTEARELLSEQLKAAAFDPLEMVELRLQGEELATLDDFEELLAVDVANVDRMPHQAAVARRALSQLHGRAILADEVGLGKTIEAGLAIKELTLRGLAKRVLVLCPAPLRDQWREEMNHKFDLQFEVAWRGVDVGAQEKLIISQALGTREIEKLTKQPWDIVIVDEAHRAAGTGARKRRELITALTIACRYALLLTATPVQNDLLELYRLVELLRPGTFKSVGAFKREFMRGSDRRTPSDPAALRRLISSVMIRTTRAQAGVDRVVRRAVDVPIELGPNEHELYELSVDLLRNVMRGSGDAMRRRSLALRLTSSPFSMGTTALRMADRHPDEPARKALNEVGHFAMDIKGSARENRVLEITHGWLRDHGRVLIFTQHTDTVTGLMRRMEADGLNARAFHGSMSRSERASSISAFKSGEAPVMISTDAGAEGQNLQFCNCVLNYDLPWNPMRIEQRIGRVDRLTQSRDEVFVANLYARRTIDESVYRLLADKLRMFELLFGQVTTILGELDDSKSATFETRVLGALFADNDTKMAQLLAQLGSELADARERASTLIAADSGLSSWMGSAFDHRKGLTKAGAAELAPEVTERARIRQRRVQAWVRRVLKALDAQVLHDTGEGDGAFLTAQLDEEVAGELGGRPLLHLAFDRLGLENHSDAELCAVGSPVFDELLGLLRMRGDMHATVPVIPDDIGPSPFNHSPNITLVRRHLIPSGTWTGHATFRATVGEAETSEHIITADVIGSTEVRLPRRPLEDGECLPAVFDEPSKIITTFESKAVGQLEKLRSGRLAEVEREQTKELDRIQSGYQAQIAEAPFEDRERLQRALSSEVRRLTRHPDIRARAKLLALTLDEDDWEVEETWTGPGGAEATLTYEWGLSEPPTVESDASQEPIKVLALCSRTHWVDAAEVTHCSSCDSDLCGACGEAAVFADCPLCGLAACGACRATTGGLCRRCNSPERVPEFDQKFALAWRLNRGVTLLVGERVAELRWPDESEPALVVPDGDVDDPNRIRLRSYAVHNGLPADSGLVLRDLSSLPASEDSARFRLRSSTTIEVELSTAQDCGSAIDAAAIEDVPEQNQPTIVAEKVAKLAPLLGRLRTDVPPPAPPAVIVTRRGTCTDIYLEAERIVEQVTVTGDDGAATVIDEHAAPLQWREPSLDDAVLAEAALSGLRVSFERRNEAVLVTAREDGQSGAPRCWIALPDGAKAADQLAWFRYLKAQGTAGGRVGQPPIEAQEVSGPFPTPTECELASRRIEPVAEFTQAPSGSDLVAAEPRALRAVDKRAGFSPVPPPAALPAELSRALLDATQLPFTAAVRNGFEVQEAWRGHGTATYRYRTFDGQSRIPKLDDDSYATDFGVCRDSHFYAAGTAALCASCRTWACRACDNIDHQASITCPSCSASVCRRCLSATHTVSNLLCVICSDGACPGCGRDPGVSPCAVCDRDMCSSCRTGEMCPPCSQLVLASEEQLASLPKELAITGATVLIASDDDATTILLSRGDVVEQTVVRHGAIDRWVAFGRSAIDDVYRLRLAASRDLEVQVVPVIERPEGEASIDEPHVVLQSHRAFHPAWSAMRLEKSRWSSESFDSPDHSLARLIADQFTANVRLPDVVEALPQQVRDAFAQMPQPEVVELAIRWDRVGRDIVVTASGILDRTLNGSVVREKEIAWTEGGVTPDWVAADWNPVPVLRAYAAVDAVEVVVVGMASLLALGARQGGRPEWYAISTSPAAPAATSLARWMGVGDADEVSAFTDPAKLTRSSVSNAIDVSINVRPVGSVKLGVQQKRQNTTADALKAWLPATQPMTPVLGVLPNRPRILLEQRLRTPGARTSLVIGARVEEIVMIEGGRTWRHDVNLAPGETDARWIDTATRLRLDEGVIDREGHFGPARTRCDYCGARTCPLCVDGMVACDCCTAPICRRCVQAPHADLWLCLACATIRKPTRSEARQHGRWLSTRRMLVGFDPQHTVVVEHKKNRWLLHAGDDEKYAIAGPSVIEFLNARLAQ